MRMIVSGAIDNKLACISSTEFTGIPLTSFITVPSFIPEIEKGPSGRT